MMLNLTPTPGSPITLEQFLDDQREHTLIERQPMVTSEMTELPGRVTMTLHSDNRKPLVITRMDRLVAAIDFFVLWSLSRIYEVSVVLSVAVIVSAFVVYSGLFERLVR
jgi:hypothetical protein